MHALHRGDLRPFVAQALSLIVNPTPSLLYLNRIFLATLNLYLTPLTELIPTRITPLRIFLLVVLPGACIVVTIRQKKLSAVSYMSHSFYPPSRESHLGRTLADVLSS